MGPDRRSQPTSAHAARIADLLRCAYVCDETGQYEDARALAQEAIGLAPHSAESWFVKGLALSRLEHFGDAASAYRESLAYAPEHAGAWDNLGLSLMSMNQIPDAHDAFTHAIQLEPGRASAQWNRGLCLLLMGDLIPGFSAFPWRWKIQNGPQKESFPLPAWSGEPPVGKTLLLVDEQGFGDTLQFCRYIPQIRSMGARVVLLVSPPLFPLLRHWPGITVVCRGEQILSPIDAYATLPDLPRLCKTTLKTIPPLAHELRLGANEPKAAAKWRAILAKDNRKGQRIGINWAGRPTHLDDRNRSCALKSMLDGLGDLNKAVFVSLQKPLNPEDAELLVRHNIQNLGSQITDFADAAALYNLLDLVITVDSAPAHLAGSLGKPVWCLLSYAPDWRWMLERSDTPWYDSMTLFRPPSHRDWSDLFAQIRTALLNTLSD